MFLLKNSLGAGAVLIAYWLGRGVGGWGGGVLFGFVALCALTFALDRWDTRLRLAAEGRAWARDIVLSTFGLAAVLIIAFFGWGK
jgi:hypothetical protein